MCGYVSLRLTQMTTLISIDVAPNQLSGILAPRNFPVRADKMAGVSVGDAF